MLLALSFVTQELAVADPRSEVSADTVKLCVFIVNCDWLSNLIWNLDFRAETRVQPLSAVLNNLLVTNPAIKLCEVYRFTKITWVEIDMYIYLDSLKPVAGCRETEQKVTLNKNQVSFSKLWLWQAADGIDWLKTYIQIQYIQIWQIWAKSDRQYYSLSNSVW